MFGVVNSAPLSLRMNFGKPCSMSDEPFALHWAVDFFPSYANASRSICLEICTSASRSFPMICSGL
jgi:hypothetical protein